MSVVIWYLSFCVWLNILISSLHHVTNDKISLFLWFKKHTHTHSTFLRQASLKFETLLPQSSEYWGYRYAPLGPTSPLSYLLCIYYYFSQGYMCEACTHKRVHVSVDASACAHVCCMCMWRPKVDTGSPPWLFSTFPIKSEFLRWTQNSLIWLVSLTGFLCDLLPVSAL